jgi:hypothetical protein
LAKAILMDENDNACLKMIGAANRGRGYGSGNKG